MLDPAADGGGRSAVVRWCKFSRWAMKWLLGVGRGWGRRGGGGKEQAEEGGRAGTAGHQWNLYPTLGCRAWHAAASKIVGGVWGGAIEGPAAFLRGRG